MDWLNGKLVEWLNRSNKKSTILKQKKIYSLQKKINKVLNINQ